jgi:hypothetical protein
MSNLLNRIKGAFVEEVPLEESTQTTTIGGNLSNVHPLTSGNVTGVFDQQIYNDLTQAISAKDLPGNDYLEFKAALKPLQAAGLNEEQQFKAAFAVLSANGLTKDILFKSLDTYTSVVNSEKDEFKQTLSNVISTKVSGKQKELADNDLQVENLKSQIKAIEQQIIVLNTKSTSLTEEINETKNKVALTEANFNVTSDTLLNQLLVDKDKINKYIA